MLKLRDLEIGYPQHLFLEISDRQQKQAWTKVQSYSNPTVRCQAYLNYLCWDTFIPWLKTWCEEETSQKNNANNCLDKSIIFESSLPELWEFVNGSIVNYHGVKLALIPSETTELEEFDIPQEWVDIPQWQADYYLAIQINFDVSEQAWMRVLGSVSYQQLKEKGEFEKSDRIYYIDSKYLEEDITEILLEAQPSVKPQQQLATQAELSLETINSLLAKLGNSVVYHPRLEIPFQQWQCLITNSEWRKELYQKRNRQTTKLRTWLTNIATEIQELATEVKEDWQMLDTLINPVQPSYSRSHFSNETVNDLITLLEPNNPEQVRSQAAGLLGKVGVNNLEARQALIKLLETTKEEKIRWEAALSLGKIDPQNSYAGTAKGKIIDLGIKLAEQKIALLVAIIPDINSRIKVWLQLKPIDHSYKLPPNLQLKVISEGNIRLAAESRISDDGTGKDDCVQLSFTPPVGTEFTVQVSLNNANFTEKFIA